MPKHSVPGFPALTVERDVPAVMRDGTKLYSDVYRPVTKAELPVLLIRLPYDKRTAGSSFGQAHPIWYAGQGYIVVVQDTRGRYASEGEFYPYRHESADGFDTVEWASSLEGADGKIGMFGFSYIGATQLLAAVEQPPALRTIVPGFTASQYYEGWTYNGGAFALGFIGYWANLLALETAMRNGDEEGFSDLGRALANASDLFWSLPISEYPALQGPHAPYFHDWVEHTIYDEYWRQWSIERDYSRIVVPAMHIGGWYDVFLSGTAKNFAGLASGAGLPEARASQKLLIGPWAHMPWTPLGDYVEDAPTANTVDEWHIRWFDQLLKGQDRGVLDSPVTLHLYSGGRRDFDAWPPLQAEPQDWYVHSGGRANSKFGDGRLSRERPGEESPDVFLYDPSLPTPSLGGHSCCFDTITPMGPADQHVAEVSRMMLVYTSEPLARPIDIVGEVSVTLFAASSATDTDFAARLCIVDDAGRSVNLQEGIIRARYRESLTEARLMTPGEVYEFTIHLGPVGAHVPAGWSLRLDVSSSDFPQWDRNLNTGGPVLRESLAAAQVATQTVLHDADHPTRLTLPVCRV